jgi:hypothetical protein
LRKKLYLGKLAVHTELGKSKNVFVQETIKNLSIFQRIIGVLRLSKKPNYGYISIQHTIKKVPGKPDGFESKIMTKSFNLTSNTNFSAVRSEHGKVKNPSESG